MSVTDAVLRSVMTKAWDSRHVLLITSHLAQKGKEVVGLGVLQKITMKLGTEN